jgi:hypothetical protein
LFCPIRCADRVLVESPETTRGYRSSVRMRPMGLIAPAQSVGTKAPPPDRVGCTRSSARAPHNGLAGLRPRAAPHAVEALLAAGALSRKWMPQARNGFSRSDVISLGRPHCLLTLHQPAAERTAQALERTSRALLMPVRLVRTSTNRCVPSTAANRTSESGEVC